MTKKRHNTSIFQVGEEINPPSHNVRLRVTSVNQKDNSLEAIVIKAEGVYSEASISPQSSREFFTLGMEIIFKQDGTDGWTPKNKLDPNKRLPWFMLSVDKHGKKHFAHWR